jgi:hypothetical protein
MNKKTKIKKTMVKKIPRYNVYVSDMFQDTKQPKKHQERFIRIDNMVNITNINIKTNKG